MRRRRSRQDGLRALDAPLMEEQDHPGRPWLTTVGVLVVLVVVTGAFFYAPLEVGADTGCPEGSEAVPPEETDEGPVDAAALCLVQHEPGRTVVLDVGVRNGGPLPVTVTGVEFDATVGELLELVEVRAGAAGAPSELVPMEPFRLPSGAERRLEVEARLRSCEARPGGRLLTLTHLPVRTRFVVVTKTAHVPLTSQLGILLGSCAP